jgi:hypothetical protein
MKLYLRNTEKYHTCRKCKLYANRLYIRIRKLESMSSHNEEKPGFKAIGWYCEQCKIFETDEMINRQRSESLREELGMTDQEYEEYVRSASSSDIMSKAMSKAIASVLRK